MSARRIQRSLIVLLLLASCGILSTEILAPRSPSPQERAAATPRTDLSLIRAKKPLMRGSTIRLSDIELVKTTEPLPQGAFTRLAEATGLVATRDISTSEPLSSSNAAMSFKPASLAESVPVGYRAIALRVTEESAVANLIRPGDHVDVLIASTPNPSPPGERMFPAAESRTVLQNVLVLAVGAAMAGDKPNVAAVRNVTLAVTPPQAAMMALLHSIGTEYLSLRTAGDNGEAQNLSISTRQLIGGNEDRAGKSDSAASARTQTVEVISGASQNTKRLSVEAGR